LLLGGGLAVAYVRRRGTAAPEPALTAAEEARLRDLMKK